MRLGISALVLSAMVGMASPASAQTRFEFTSGGTTTAFGGYLVGQYQGIMGAPPGQNVVLNCVDFFHSVRVGDVWMANLTSLATPGTNISGPGQVTRFNNLQLYRQAAWLTTQYAVAPGETANIQATIWDLFPGNPSPQATNDPYWYNLSLAYVTDPNRVDNDYAGFYVVSDVNTHSDPQGSIQEFIIDEDIGGTVVTPEPASLALLGSGLLVLGYGIRRRRK